jgi:hypothetical protein
MVHEAQGGGSLTIGHDVGCEMDEEKEVSQLGWKEVCLFIVVVMSGGATRREVTCSG